jgi:hypothetical protein
MINKRLKTNSCELCNRTDLKLTFHHLVPRKMQRKNYIIKQFVSINLNNHGIYVCIPCHKMIHRKIGHRELAEVFNSKEMLLDHPEIKKFVAFNRKNNKRKNVN